MLGAGGRRASLARSPSQGTGIFTSALSTEPQTARADHALGNYTALAVRAGVSSGGT